MSADSGSSSKVGMFGLLPESKTPWTEFVFSYSVQALAVAFLIWIQIIQPHILRAPEHTERSVELVPTPPPVNHRPQPLRQLPRVVAELDPPATLRLPASVARPKVKLTDTPAPQVHMTEQKIDLPLSSPAIPKQIVRTNVFSTGSSAAPTTSRAPQQVQTGGFGDPNGIPAKGTPGKAVNIAQMGSFDMPTGGGSGNGTGGTKGVRGVVVSSGFGNGIAVDPRSSAPRGAVHQSTFADASAPVAESRARPVQAASRAVEAEILSKPVPAYTEEARRLRVEGEVLLQAVLEADGKVRVLRVVRGLGHGLDDEAVRAAQQIRFRPAMQDGQPADSTVILHIVFQLA